MNASTTDRYNGVPLGVEALTGPLTVQPTKGPLMKRILLPILLAAASLAGCAQLQPQAEGGASAYETQRPYPKSASDLGLS